MFPSFGLKNKSKSKKVQSYVNSVTNSVNNSGDRKQRQDEEKRKKQRADQKMRKKAMKEETDALFNEGALDENSGCSQYVLIWTLSQLFWFYFYLFF